MAYDTEQTEMTEAMVSDRQGQSGRPKRKVGTQEMTDQIGRKAKYVRCAYGKISIGVGMSGSGAHRTGKMSTYPTPGRLARS